MRYLLVSILLLFVFAPYAQARLIYDWEPVSSGQASPNYSQDPSEDFTTTGGQLIIEYSDPSNSFFYNQSRQNASSDRESPFLSISLFGDGDFADFTLTPRAAGRPAWSISSGLSRADPYLMGSIYANNSETDFDMASVGNDGLWRFERLSSDYGGPCFQSPGCSGGTGRWTLTSVPAPAGGYLLGFTLIALGGLNARSKQRRQMARDTIA